MSANYIAPEGVIQLESVVADAAKEVERCDAADEMAVEEVVRLERERVEIEAQLQQAEDTRQKVACDRLGAYWTLGRAITDLEGALAADKGKHGKQTPRQRAIELAGNNARYQRAKEISVQFGSRADAEESARCRSFNEILRGIAEEKAAARKHKGQEAPGRKPMAKKTSVKAIGRKAPVSQGKAAAEEKEEGTTDEEAEDTQSPVTPEEVKIVNTFVDAVGGWGRAVWLIEECYQKWQQNQKG